MNTSVDLVSKLALLARTPGILKAWLDEVPEAWMRAREGAETWSTYDVLGHLIHGEKTDWVPRAEHILFGDPDTPFTPFDRDAQFRNDQGRPARELLEEFEGLRLGNLARLGELALTDSDLTREGTHPAFGRVTLGQLLSTWVAHDLSHLAQVARVMAFQLKEDVGPWQEYLGILNR